MDNIRRQKDIFKRIGSTLKNAVERGEDLCTMDEPSSVGDRMKCGYSLWECVVKDSKWKRIEP